jgi:hypothetical protein
VLSVGRTNKDLLRGAMGITIVILAILNVANDALNMLAAARHTRRILFSAAISHNSKSPFK